MTDVGLQRAFVLALAAIFLLWLGTALVVVVTRVASPRLPAGRKWRRIRALQRTTSLAHLGDALASEDPDVVGAAVTRLGALGTAPAARLLVRALVDGRYERSQVAAQLDHLRIAVGRLLVPLCSHFDPAVRRWAVTLLGRYAHRPEVALELVAASGDPDPDVRAAGVRALAHVEQPAAVAAAVELLGDEIWYVRANAVRTLATLNRPEFGALVSELLADEQWWVRAAAKDALEAMGEPALPALIRALRGQDEFARDSAAEVMARIARRAA